MAVVSAARQRWGAGQLLLAVPRLGVSAAVGSLGYESDGMTPATPTTPWGVGWYTFSASPGAGSNAVFSGHVDWFTGAPAVFAGLRQLDVGDAIYLIRPDGTPLIYSVSTVELVRPQTASVPAIFGGTSRDAITLITCGGSWDAAAKDYTHRLIVRAYRTR